MVKQRYSVTPHPIETLLTWVKTGEIAIPEIQRPFVWEAVQVRDLLDSLYQGYPVGYLVAWRNPSVRLKDGTTSEGKRILIDGQQRVSALMAALLGREVLTKKYKTVRIRIAFHPVEEKFEVSNPAIQKDRTWIPDLADLFSPDASLIKLTRDYADRNPDINQDKVSIILERVRNITNNNVGVIELDQELDIKTVTEIFIRVNSKGTALSQADFVMSKIAANDTYGGNTLRKAIDYFCHLAKAPDILRHIETNDEVFATSEFLPKMLWLKNAKDDLYKPLYSDMLHVAFTSEFGRGKLQDLVALLSGRNFETKKFEEAVAEEAFAKLKSGILNFINETHFDRFTMILHSAGFVTSKLIRSKSAINFAYVLYLRGRAENMPDFDIERLVKRWYVMSVLRKRYSGSSETIFDSDIRQIEMQGLAKYTETVIDAELTGNFWTTLLPQEMNTSSVISPFFLVYKAAQVKLGDVAFLSRDMKVSALLQNRGDVHHLYPKKYLKNQGMTKGQYNQIANCVLAQSEINIRISDHAPEVYFSDIAKQCKGGPRKHGGITDLGELRANLAMSCVPQTLLSGEVTDYGEFLDTRRKLMAQKIRIYFESL